MTIPRGVGVPWSVPHITSSLLTKKGAKSTIITVCHKSATKAGINMMFGKEVIKPWGRRVVTCLWLRSYNLAYVSALSVAFMARERMLGVGWGVSGRWA